MYRHKNGWRFASSVGAFIFFTWKNLGSKSATNTGYAPWNIVDATDKKQALLQALHILTIQINQAEVNRKALPEILYKDYPLLKMPKQIAICPLLGSLW